MNRPRLSRSQRNYWILCALASVSEILLQNYAHGLPGDKEVGSDSASDRAWLMA